MNKLSWYFKQILPLTYVSTYKENEKKKLCIFKMWFGRCFKIRYFNLKESK